MNASPLSASFLWEPGGGGLAGRRGSFPEQLVQLDPYTRICSRTYKAGRALSGARGGRRVGEGRGVEGGEGGGRRGGGGRERKEREEAPTCRTLPPEIYGYEFIAIAGQGLLCRGVIRGVTALNIRKSSEGALCFDAEATRWPRSGERNHSRLRHSSRNLSSSFRSRHSAKVCLDRSKSC